MNFCHENHIFIKVAFTDSLQQVSTCPLGFFINPIFRSDVNKWLRNKLGERLTKSHKLNNHRVLCLGASGGSMTYWIITLSRIKHFHLLYFPSSQKHDSEWKVLSLLPMWFFPDLLNHQWVHALCGSKKLKY